MMKSESFLGPPSPSPSPSPSSPPPPPPIPGDEEDSPQFQAFMAQALSMNFDSIEKSQAIGVGFDSNGHDTIYIIPSLAISLMTNQHLSEIEILRQLCLYFLKIAEPIVHFPFNIVYGHSNFSFFHQFDTMRSLNHLLPRRYRKNLLNLFILHPTARVHVFATVAKVFFGKRVEPKMRYVSCIAELQSIISPMTLPLPPAFLLWEDKVYFQRTLDEEMPTLTELYDDSLGAPLLVVQCLDYLRQHGLHTEGLFRVAGDQILFEVAKVRIQKSGGTNVIICRPPERVHDTSSAMGSSSPSPSRDDGEFKIDRQNTLNSQRSIGQGYQLRDSPSLPPRRSFAQRVQGFNRKSTFPMADVLLHDVHEVAQVPSLLCSPSLAHPPPSPPQLLKSFLRNLPEPVVTTAAYRALLEASKLQHADAESSLEIIEQILADPELMPLPHIRTFEYLMRSPTPPSPSRRSLPRLRSLRELVSWLRWLVKVRSIKWDPTTSPWCSLPP
jgi:hypothetical protein